MPPDQNRARNRAETRAEARDRRNREALSSARLSTDLGRRTARGGAIGAASQGIRMLIGFAAIAALARLLAPQEFGLVAMAGAAAGFLGMFADLGLSAATVQRREIDQNITSALFLINLAAGLGVALLLCGIAPLAAWFFQEPQVAALVIGLAAPIPLAAAGRQHAALLQRHMRWGVIEGIAIAAQLAGAAGAVALAAFAGIGPWALVAQGWIGAILSTALLWRFCAWRPDPVADWAATREALGFGINLTAFQFLNYFHRQFDDVLVGRRWGAEDLGFYNRAYALLTSPLKLLTEPVTAAAIPALSRVHGDDRAWADLYVSILQAVMLAAAPMGCALILLAPDLVAILFGPGWERSAEIFRILSLSILAQPVMSSTGWLWVSAGRTDEMLAWALRSIPAMLAAMLIGLPYGAEGVAAGYALSICALTPLCTVFAARSLPIRPRAVWAAIAPPMLAACAAAAAVHWGPVLWESVFPGPGLPGAPGLAAAPAGILGAAAKGAMFLGLYCAIMALLAPAIPRRLIRVLRSSLRRGG